MFKKWLPMMMLAGITLSVATGCVNSANATGSETSKSDEQTKMETPIAKKPKYVFMFIGDGMSSVQTNAAQILNGNNKVGEVALNPLGFTQFESVGLTSVHDSTSFAPDSASTATSLSSGYKTHSGVIGLYPDKEEAGVSIAEMARDAGMKVGVVSSVQLNHATPAAYYAHEQSRNNYYEIALQMAESDFDYFGGGGLISPTGKEEDQTHIYEILQENGYTLVNSNDEILALDENSGKVYAMDPTIEESDPMLYAMDMTEDQLGLDDFVQKGIDVLDSEEGFFMAVESGKIDWAGHANDAMANIGDVLAFDEAIQVAVDFANEHPDETLIVVTGDHETGGMSIGHATTGYDTAFQLLNEQTMSYEAFDALFEEMVTENEALTFDEAFTTVTENFGLLAPSEEADNPLVLTAYEYEKLQDAFEVAMTAKEERESSQEHDLLYGGYNPFTVTLTHTLNNKAGIGWTTYSHTGVPIPLYATGAGSEIFNGSYDNTEVFHKLAEVMELN